MQIYKQRNKYDCHLCCIAMAVQRAPEDIFSPELIAQVEEDKSTGRRDSTESKKLLALAGLIEDIDFWEVYCGSFSSKSNLLQLLLGRRAILQVQSLNERPPANHMVYWDGKALHDPSTRQMYHWLQQCTSVGYITIFNELPNV